MFNNYNPKVFELIGNAFLDKDFREDIHSNPDRLDDYKFNEQDNTIIYQEISNMIDLFEKMKNFDNAPPIQSINHRNSPYPPEITEKLPKLIPEIEVFAFRVFKKSIAQSTKTFSRISLMSYAIFGVGIFLFTLSAITSIWQGKEYFSIGFGALGVISFVSLFIISPTKRIQTALSNLLQAEMLFMNFWNQLHFWTTFGASENIMLKEKGSERLHTLTLEIISKLESNLKGTRNDISKENLKTNQVKDANS